MVVSFARIGVMPIDTRGFDRNPAVEAVALVTLRALRDVILVAPGWWLFWHPGFTHRLANTLALSLERRVAAAEQSRCLAYAEMRH